MYILRKEVRGQPLVTFVEPLFSALLGKELLTPHAQKGGPGVGIS